MASHRTQATSAGAADAQIEELAVVRVACVAALQQQAFHF
jgi:hypothetical protein